MTSKTHCLHRPEGDEASAEQAFDFEGSQVYAHPHHAQALLLLSRVLHGVMIARQLLRRLQPDRLEGTATATALLPGEPDGLGRGISAVEHDPEHATRRGAEVRAVV